MATVVSNIVCLIFVLISIAFFTLCERNLLGYIHLRNGPCNVGFMGIMQPFADAGNLFIKERLYLLVSNKVCYFFAPLLLLTLSIFFWCMYPIDYCFSYVEFSLVLFLCVSSGSVYGTIIAGWGSNSNYALLGGVRAIAQTISYEVSLSFVILSPVIIIKSLIIIDIFYGQMLIINLLIFFGVGLMWFISVLAETNRAPFDFVEGESELVSGFNVEYGGYGFAMIFIAEYINILFISIVSVCLWLGVILPCFVGVCVFVSYCFVWVRGAYPRYRYDLLMSLTWNCFLPLSISILVCFVGWISINF